MSNSMIQVLKSRVNQEHGDFHVDGSVVRGDKRPLQLGQIDARNLLVDPPKKRHHT